MANTHSLDLELSSSQYASIADASQTGLDLLGSFALEAWINPESLAADMQIVGNGRRAATRNGYLLRYVHTGTLLQFIYSNAGTDYTTQYNISGVITTGTWYHIAAVHDAANDIDYLYIDGVEVAQNTGRTTDAGNSSDPFRIGARADLNADYWDGKIDEVRVWSDVRTSTEINNNKALELVGNEANLVGYWKLNNNYTDSTSNGNNLTASGSPVFSVDVPFVGTTNYSVDLAVGSFTLTGINAVLLYGKTLDTSVGSFVLTGNSAVFNRTILSTFSVANFILTGIDISISRASIINALVGQFVLTGNMATLTTTAWSFTTKPSTNWSNSSKQSTSWSNQSKGY